MALVPYTIWSTGIDREQRMVWDANDTATSATFQVSASGEERLRTLVEQSGCDPAALVPFGPDGEIYS